MYASANNLIDTYGLSRSNVNRGTRLMKDCVAAGILPDKAVKKIGSSIRFDEEAFLWTKDNEKEIKRRLGK